MLNSTYGQNDYKPTDKIPTSISLISKFHSVITFLETKDFYKKGMSEEEFIDKTTSCLEDKELKKLFAPYMSQIFYYHENNFTSDKVYDSVKGDNFITLTNALERYMEDPVIRKEMLLKKPKWFNYLRKIIDWIDDHWK